MRRRGGLLGILTAAIVLTGMSAGEARACTGSLLPFAKALAGAEAIAVVTVVEGAAPIEDLDREEVFRVDRVLRGALPPVVSLVRPKAHACGDSLAGTIGDVGASAIVAFGVEAFGGVIHPVWTEDPAGGLGGTAEAPSGVTTLAQLELVVAGDRAVPMAEATGPMVGTAAAIVVAALAGFLALAWRMRRRASAT